MSFFNVARGSYHFFSINFFEIMLVLLIIICKIVSF
jgi:hypothetical protein